MGEYSLQDRKICLISLGCDKNLVDSEIMLGLLKEAGAELTPDEEEADAVVVNTCGFIAPAVAESVETVERALSRKKGKMPVVVVGCLVNRYRRDILGQISQISAIVGTNDFESIAGVVRDAIDGKKSERLSDAPQTPCQENILKRVVSTPAHYAYVKIAEGCDNRCTYCAIPQIRGAFRSRKIEDIAEEARQLADKGAKELILVAQDTSLYGVDLYGKASLHALLRELSQIEGVEWLRVLYSYPEHITDDLIDEIAGNPKVCKYVDMPIQHSDSGVLKRMGRRGSREELNALVAKLRAKIPSVTLRTTVIAGFPGETDRDFDGLLDFIRESRFDRLGAFPFYAEEGTPAERLPGHVPEKVKRRRYDRLMRLQQEISREKGEAIVGSKTKVIVDGKAPYEKGYYVCRGEGHCPDADGVVFVESHTELATGSFLEVKIIESDEYDLIAER